MYDFPGGQGLERLLASPAAWGLALLALVLVVALVELRRLRKKRAIAPAASPFMTVPVPPLPPPPPALPAGPVQARLVGVGGAGAGATHPLVLESSVAIGKSRGCDVCIEGDAGVRDAHCVLRRDGDTIMLAQLGEVGVTYLNGIPIRGPRAITHGDTIGVGNTVLRLVLGPAP